MRSWLTSRHGHALFEEELRLKTILFWSNAWVEHCAWPTHLRPDVNVTLPTWTWRLGSVQQAHIWRNFTSGSPTSSSLTLAYAIRLWNVLVRFGRKGLAHNEQVASTALETLSVESSCNEKGLLLESISEMSRSADLNRILKLESANLVLRGSRSTSEWDGLDQETPQGGELGLWWFRAAYVPAQVPCMCKCIGQESHWQDQKSWSLMFISGVLFIWICFTLFMMSLSILPVCLQTSLISQKPWGPEAPLRRTGDGNFNEGREDSEEGIPWTLEVGLPLF